jgi:hypothetical protein
MSQRAAGGQGGLAHLQSESAGTRTDTPA